MKEWFNSLTPQVKGIITISVGIVALVVAFVITKSILKAIEKAKNKKDPKQTVKDAEADLVIEQNKGETLSKPLSDYTGAADTIQKLLDGCETSDSEIDVVINIIKVVKKPIDWFYLIKVFGVKEVDNCGPFTGSTEYSLISLLKDQLDSVSLYYTINIDGYKDSGSTINTLNVLSAYLKTIGVTI